MKKHHYLEKKRKKKARSCKVRKVRFGPWMIKSTPGASSGCVLRVSAPNEANSCIFNSSLQLMPFLCSLWFSRFANLIHGFQRRWGSARGAAAVQRRCSSGAADAKCTVELAVWRRGGINSAALFNCRREHLGRIRRSSLSARLHRCWLRKHKSSKHFRNTMRSTWFVNFSENLRVL